MNPKVRKIAEIVETAASTYWPALKSIYKDVKEGNIYSVFSPFSHFLDLMDFN